MARKSSNKKINNSDFRVGEKYNLVNVLNRGILPKLDPKFGIDSAELLNGFDLEQMLNAYLDDQNVWTINLNSSFYALNIPEEVFSYHVTTSEMHWPTVSHQIYGTTRLAWLLMKLNDVKDSNIFSAIPPGTAVRYLDRSKYVDNILEALREGAEE